MEKKGELTSSEIVSTALAIGVFIVVLIFLFVILDLRRQSDRDICELSVITRATSPEATQKYFPLKCTTNKICLTFKEDCEQFIGEENVENIKLSSSEAKVEASARKIEKIAADEMFFCWDMTGQGKLDLFGNSISFNVFENLENFLNLQEKGASCIICSRIAISEEFKSSPEGKRILEKVDVNRYLQKEQVPGSSLTYLQTFTDRQLNALPGEVIDEFGRSENIKNGTDHIAILFSQIKSDGDIGDEFKSGALAGTVFVFGSTYAVGATGKVIKAAAKNPLGAVAALIAVVGTAGLKAYGAKKSQDISAAYCGKFTSTEQNRYGCSIVTQADFNNEKALNSLCTKIEGNL